MSELLVLGPLLRYVGETTATIWVQTQQSGRVTVRSEGRSWSAPTFAVHGFHYALVVLDGLAPDTVQPYEVAIDGEPVWPPRDSEFPPSRIKTLHADETTRLAFGSCRTSSAHDEQGNKVHGIDALRAYAFSMASAERSDGADWPDLCVFLGDQVYADEEISPQMEEFIANRRDTSKPPYEEIKDYVEYDQLYQLAWKDPAVRWVLSTLPTAMIFDDHDVRDDWNTSWDWRQEIQAQDWWQERLVAAMGSYWVYQHAGNLSPAALADDEVWQRISQHADSGAEEELDLTDFLDEFAQRVDEHPDSYRWSYTRDLGESRLIMIDSRAARELTPEHRSMLDKTEMSWLQGELTGGDKHLFIGTSLPFLLPPGLHDFEAMDEVMAQGGYGRAVGAAAEKVRRVIDLEHWAAFNSGFAEVAEAVMEVARGDRGPAPKIITFLSGDVHNSYLAEVTAPHQYGAKAPIVQAVCSPMRNPMPHAIRFFMSLFAKGLVKPMRAIAGRSSKVPDPAYPWKVTEGPWFDNNLAVCETGPDSQRFRWYAGELGDDDATPYVRVVHDVTVTTLS